MFQAKNKSFICIILVEILLTLPSSPAFLLHHVYNAYNCAQPYGAYLTWACALTTD